MSTQVGYSSIVSVAVLQGLQVRMGLNQMHTRYSTVPTVVYL